MVLSISNYDIFAYLEICNWILLPLVYTRAFWDELSSRAGGIEALRRMRTEAGMFRSQEGFYLQVQFQPYMKLGGLTYLGVLEGRDTWHWKQGFRSSR